MRRYPTRDEIIEQEDDRRWLKEVTKETQPMSDTLPASAHRVNSSGNCSISGCPCRGWSAQETTSAKEEESEMSTKSVCVLTGAATESAEDCSTHRHRIESHQPAARGGGDGKLSMRDFDYHQYGDVTLNVTNNGVTVAVAYIQGRGREAKEWAEKISAAYNYHQSLVAEREQMVEALKGVAVMLNTALAKYDEEPWAQRVRAAIVNYEQRSTSE